MAGRNQRTQIRSQVTVGKIMKKALILIGSASATVWLIAMLSNRNSLYTHNPDTLWEWNNYLTYYVHQWLFGGVFNTPPHWQWALLVVVTSVVSLTWWKRLDVRLLRAIRDRYK